MPNILLTTRCNLSCRYCFAQEKLSASRLDMSWENVQLVIDFLKRSQFPFFRVMGGEPTLHPKFNEIILNAINAGLRVDLLSNATWSENTAEVLNRISSTALLFLLNIDFPDNYTQIQWNIIQRNLSALKNRGGITLSFNICEKQPLGDGNYILDLAQQYGFKYIRLSLSLPVLGMENSHLPIEELFMLAPFVMRFIKKAESKGISVRFDNAVPPCIFNESQLGYLLQHNVYDFHRNVYCDPIIDIGPDLKIWSCFCLSSIKNRQLSEFQTLDEAQAYYRKVWSIYQFNAYPMDKCINCYFKQKWHCQGGCLSYTIKKDNGTRYATQHKDSFIDSFSQTTIFTLAEGVNVLYFDIPKTTCILRKNSENLDFEVSNVFQHIIPIIDGQHTLGEIEAALYTKNTSDYVRIFIQNTLAEELHELFKTLLQQGFLRIAEI